MTCADCGRSSFSGFVSALLAAAVPAFACSVAGNGSDGGGRADAADCQAVGALAGNCIAVPCADVCTCRLYSQCMEYDIFFGGMPDGGGDVCAAYPRLTTVQGCIRGYCASIGCDVNQQRPDAGSAFVDGGTVQGDGGAAD